MVGSRSWPSWAAGGVRGEVTLVIAGATTDPAAELAGAVERVQGPGGRGRTAQGGGGRGRSGHRCPQERPLRRSSRSPLSDDVSRNTVSSPGLGLCSPADRRGDRVSLPPLPDPLPHPVVDSHCHLDTAHEVSGLEPGEAIERAAAVGITRIVQIGCDLAGARFAVEAADRWDNVIAGVAIHPNDAARMRPDELPPGAGRDRAAGPRPTGPGGGGDRAWTTTGPATRRGTGSSGTRSPGTSPWPAPPARPWSSTIGTRTPTCSTCWTPRACRTGW